MFSHYSITNAIMKENINNFGGRAAVDGAINGRSSTGKVSDCQTNKSRFNCVRCALLPLCAIDFVQ